MKIKKTNKNIRNKGDLFIERKSFIEIIFIPFSFKDIRFNIIIKY